MSAQRTITIAICSVLAAQFCILGRILLSLELCILLYLFVFQSELELVQSHGIPSEDIIYSGVCKQVSQIKYAAKNGIDLLVCDNEAELRKISRCHPSAK